MGRKEGSIVWSNRDSIRSDIRTYNKSQIKDMNPTAIPELLDL